MFLQELIFKTMKKIFLYTLIAVALFSCVKDVEHKYSLPSIKQVIDVSSTGVTISGSVKQHGKEPIIDHGFVWSSKGNPTLSDSRISLGALDNDKEFQAKITYDLKPNQIYYARAYIVTKDYIVYADEQSFTSLGSSTPIIERIEPAEINIYNTRQITIYGKNFCSDRANAKVNQPYTYYIESISPDSIVFRVDYISLGTNTFNLSIFDKTVPVTFEAVGLTLEKIEPKTAEIGSVVSIKGRFLGYINRISHIGDWDLIDIIEKNDTEIKIRVPVLKEGQATFRVWDSRNYIYELPPIDIISPWKIFELPFKPSDLSPWGGYQSRVTFCNYQDKLYALDNKTIYQIDIQNKTVQIIATMPEEPINNVNLFFMIGSKFYICTEDELFLSYDITTNIWEKIPSYSTSNSTPVLCFTIEEKAYIVAYTFVNSHVLFEYDSVTKMWKLISGTDQIFSNFSSVCAASIHNGKAYISSNNKIWEFDNQAYSFEEKILYPTKKYSHTYNDLIYMAGNDFHFSGSHLVMGGNDFIEYNPTTNQIREFQQYKYNYTTNMMFFWKNFLFALANTGDKYEYLVINLDEL